MKWTIDSGWLKLEGNSVIRVAELGRVVAQWFIDNQPSTNYASLSLFVKQFKSTKDCLMSYYNGAHNS